ERVGVRVIFRTDAGLFPSP
ncbi:hypothetical protein EC950183_4278, partial [Escherichia coli 95.0183]